MVDSIDDSQKTHSVLVGLPRYSSQEYQFDDFLGSSTGTCSRRIKLNRQ